MAALPSNDFNLLSAPEPLPTTLVPKALVINVEQRTPMTRKIMEVIATTGAKM
eukprot:CAMPEP_0172740098 /NCGR_PEP_ID=MMETSP1074-20121228/124112_1 /TAXON_ID=2916 /ORGANISM="Ceratium fusus, Strain PA161109" /LENGTH=52 /DNA_ID=CAMNT_0013570131 /DNA_START=266 /DNA_END=424 /DNA_ORIENTATION=+